MYSSLSLVGPLLHRIRSLINHFLLGVWHVLPLYAEVHVHTNVVGGTAAAQVPLFKHGLTAHNVLGSTINII